MIQFRRAIFETNSSSCHVFVYDPKESVAVPKTVTLVPEDEDTILNTFFNDYYCWYHHNPELFEDDLKDFLYDLLVIGVKTIKCSDNAVVKLFEKLKADGNYYSYHDKEAMIRVLFGESTKLTTMEDYEVCQEAVDEEFGKGFKYMSRRLS